jgi:hypothetical protein
MKVKKNLYLETRAVRAGERAVARAGVDSLSELVEKHLLELERAEPEHFSKHHGKPFPKNERRYKFLVKKHGKP